MGAMPKALSRMDRGRTRRYAPRVGRRTPSSGSGYLAAILTLIRTASRRRVEIEREAELGRAVVADRLATLERLDLVVEEIWIPRQRSGAPQHVFRR